MLEGTPGRALSVQRPRTESSITAGKRDEAAGAAGRAKRALYARVTSSNFVPDVTGNVGG